MLDLWPALKQYFKDLENSPRALQQFFASDESKSDEAKCVVQFLESALRVFEEPLKLLQVGAYYFCHKFAFQRTNALLLELTTIMDAFKAKIRKRKDDTFYGGETAVLLARLDDQCRADVLKKSFDKFYQISLDYIDKWYRLESLPTNISWIMLKTARVSYSEVKLLAEQVKQFEVCVNQGCNC